MPAPLVEGVTYYAQPQTSATFKVAAAVAGPAINLTTEGSRVLVISPLPIDDVLELYSRWVDGVLVAHGTPLEADDDLAYPIEIVAAVATLAGARLLWISGQRSIALGEIEMQAKAQLERWSKGVPVREIQSSEPRTNLAIASTVRVLPRYWVPVDYTEDYLP